MSYTGIRRARENGIRMAVGAARRNVVWMVLRTTLALAVVRLALGVPLVWFATRYVGTQLFGLRPGDPFSVAASVLALLTVAMASGVWTAWRAARVAPMVSQRQE